MVADSLDSIGMMSQVPGTHMSRGQNNFPWIGLNHARGLVLVSMVGQQFSKDQRAQRTAEPRPSRVAKGSLGRFAEIRHF